MQRSPSRRQTLKLSLKALTAAVALTGLSVLPHR